MAGLMDDGQADSMADRWVNWTVDEMAVSTVPEMVEMKAELSAAEWADNSAVRRDVLMVLLWVGK